MLGLRPNRRVAALAITVVGLAGLSLASASQLSINGGTLQAGNAAVGTCQPSSQVIVVALTSSFSGTAYTTTGVTLSNINAACGGLNYRLQALNTSSAPIDLNGATQGADLTGVVPTGATSLSVAFPATPTVPTSSVGRIALVIYS